MKSTERLETMIGGVLACENPGRLYKSPKEEDTTTEKEKPASEVAPPSDLGKKDRPYFIKRCFSDLKAPIYQAFSVFESRYQFAQ